MAQARCRFFRLGLAVVITLLVSTGRVGAAPILEPDFTRAPVRDTNNKLSDSFAGVGKECKPGETVRFAVNPPFDFPAVTNDCNFDILDIHLKIVGGLAGATFADVNENGKVGVRGDSSSIFQKSELSNNNTELSLSDGKIAKGEAFNPLFITRGSVKTSSESRDPLAFRRPARYY